MLLPVALHTLGQNNACTCHVSFLSVLVVVSCFRPFWGLFASGHCTFYCFLVLAERSAASVLARIGSSDMVCRCELCSRQTTHELYGTVWSTTQPIYLNLCSPRYSNICGGSSSVTDFTSQEVMTEAWSCRLSPSRKELTCCDI